MSPRGQFRKAVVLGAAGFIGLNLVDVLAAQGFQLVCFDRLISPSWPRDAIAISGDLSELPDSLLAHLDDAVVFHLISSARPSAGTAQAAMQVSQDVVGTIRILEETKSRALRWVFFSSGGTVYGPSDAERIAESCPTLPICSYGLSKLTIEQYLSLYRRLHGIDYVVVRLSNPYGPRQDPLRGQGILPALLYRAMRGDPIEIWGDGSIVRDYIYIADAIAAVLSAAESGSGGEIYNVGTGVGMSINQLISQIERSLDRRISVEYSAARSFDVPRNVLDHTKLTLHTGWRPKTTIEDGVALTASWLTDEFRLNQAPHILNRRTPTP
jgi:UDP-glucose 4-epimerase